MTSALFMGSGLDAFNNSGGYEQDQASVADDFTRNGVNIYATSAWIETPAWTAVQDIWLHYYFGDAGNTNNDWIEFRNGSTVVFKVARVSGGARRFSYLSAADTYTQIGADVTLPASTGYIDIHFKSGASGEVGVYVNGVEQMTATASMTYATDVTQIRINGIASVGGTRIAGMAVAEENTIGWRVIQGYPSANGANTEFVGDYSSVDEAVLSEADYIYSNTANQVETFAQTLVASMTGYVPRAVAVAARVKRGSTGPQGVQLALRSGGNDYFSTTRAPGLGYGAAVNVWNTNPDTSADWTASQIAALQPGAKSIT